MTEPKVVLVESSTETRNPRTVEIDMLPTLEVLELLNDEDARVAGAVRAALPSLAEAVEVAVEKIGRGGRIHYFGAGTSGRIGLLDAAELPPTFSVDPDLVQAHHAGGASGLVIAREDTEDDEEAGRNEASVVTRHDVAIGITASGRTPYVRGALQAARAAGAFTVLVSAHRHDSLADLADIHVLVETGPEAIAGSTRLKGGTAQKLVLNSFSTALMIRLGKTYSNLMVEVAPANAKLRGRVLSILSEATGLDHRRCAAMLAAAEGDTKVALVCLLAGVDPGRARQALAGSVGRVRAALAALGVTDPPAFSPDHTRPSHATDVANQEEEEEWEESNGV